MREINPQRLRYFHETLTHVTIRSARPHQHVTTRHHASDPAARGRARRRAHIRLAYNPPPHPLLAYRASSPQPVVLLLRRDHPLALMPPTFGIGHVVEMLELAENIEIRPTMTTNLLTALERIVAAKTFITLIGESAAYLQIAAGESTTVPIVHPIFEGAHARLIAKSGRPLALAPVELVGWIKMWLAVFSAAGGNDGKGKGGTASGEGFIRRLIEQRPSIAARLRCAEKRPSSRISIQSKFLTWFIDHPFRHPPSATPRFPRHRVSVLRRERPTPLVRRTQPRPSRKNLLRPDFISQDRFTNIQQNL